MTGQWMPIDTAPRDGTAFLANLVWKDGDGHYSIQTYRWHEPWGEWVLAGVLCKDDDTMPTHWMALPDPPAEGVEDRPPSDEVASTKDTDV